MNLYSQHDPSYDRLTLGTSNLTIHGYGCFLCSIATLYQHSPVELLKVPGGFTQDGLLIPDVLAKACEGGSLGTQSLPSGGMWQIAMTDHYAHLGYPTHFFCMNPDAKEQIDPLKFPCVVEPLSYNIVQYRPFTNVKLDLHQVPLAGPFPDVPANDSAVDAVAWAKTRGFMTGEQDGNFHPDEPVTRRQLAVVLHRALQ